jgi:5-methylcytosine-specific restriction endonuclease McrA
MNYENYPKNRSEAKALGSKYYFTGIPCVHGHIALRKTKGACLECLKIEWDKGKTLRKEYFSSYNRSERGQLSKAKYYLVNREKVIERAKARAVDDKRKYKKAWKEANPNEVKAFTNDRRRRHKDATPKWLTKEQKAEIRKIYKEAIRLCGDNPKSYAVDHIVPLMGKEVCGLHVPWNLRILTSEENFKKNNKLLDTGSNQA